MSWDWAIDTAKGLIAVGIAWLANYLRKQARPMLQALKKLGNIVKIINAIEAQQSIISSEQLAFYHISKNPIYIIDNVGAITYVNPAWVEMAGFRDDRDAHGYRYLLAVHPEDRGEVERQKILQGRIRFKNLQSGKVVITECVSELVYNNKGETVKTIGILYVYPDGYFN